MPISETHLIDCMEYMAGLPDKFFDLAVVDPPYGIDAARVGVGSSQKAKQKSGQIKGGNWDILPPPPEYFTELFRVSKNQIICGGNYFSLPPTRCIIAWDKGFAKRKGLDFSDFELIWTSFDKVAKIFFHDITAGLGFVTNGISDRERQKIHPTQKPVALYKWLLTNYAKPGQKIFDSHLGSQSSRIAAWDLGLDFYGCEIDKEYFEQGNARFEAHKNKPVLFQPEQMYNFEQSKLFAE